MSDLIRIWLRHDIEFSEYEVLTLHITNSRMCLSFNQQRHHIFLSFSLLTFRAFAACFPYLVTDKRHGIDYDLQFELTLLI